MEQFLMNQLLLKKETGIFAIQNTISTMLSILIPVNNPSVPPRIKEKYKVTKDKVSPNAQLTRTVVQT